MVRLFTLFNKDIVTALTRTGRKIAKRLLNYILKVHKAGHCWNGEWSILDIRVRGDGATLIIDKMAVNATKDGIVADLQKFIVLLRPYYKIEGIKGPAYFDEFHSDVMSLPELESEKFEIFQKFLADHMAFLPPASTSNLLERLFKLCDDVRRQNGHFTYHPLQRLDCLGWTKIGDIMPYHKVFHYDKTIVEPYKDNYWDLLRFVRNFSNHGLKYTQVYSFCILSVHMYCINMNCICSYLKHKNCICSCLHSFCTVPIPYMLYLFYFSSSNMNI